jgi:hypothetical protein
MLTKKEIITIITITIILGFSISLMRTPTLFLYTSLSILIILIINTIAKKISGYYFETEVEVKFWEIQRYGWRPGQHLKKPFPIGAFLPVIIAFLSLGYFKWMASLIFDVKPKIYRAAKRHGLYSFSEMTEYHLGLIAASGILANLIFAIIGYLIGFTEFAKLNIYYAFFNILPISNLDGNKIFFGSLILWSFLASIILIAVGFVFLLI